jgi:hypothetical protein
MLRHTRYSIHVYVHVYHWYVRTYVRTRVRTYHGTPSTTYQCGTIGSQSFQRRMHGHTMVLEYHLWYQGMSCQSSTYDGGGRL